jgi:hypothetical protein
MEQNELDQIIAEHVQKERDRISKSLNMSIGLYGGFYPDIAQALLSVLKDVDPIHYQKTLEIYDAAMQKLKKTA